MAICGACAALNYSLYFFVQYGAITQRNEKNSTLIAVSLKDLLVDEYMHCLHEPFKNSSILLGWVLICFIY